MTKRELYDRLNEWQDNPTYCDHSSWFRSILSDLAADVRAEEAAGEGGAIPEPAHAHAHAPAHAPPPIATFAAALARVEAIREYLVWHDPGDDVLHSKLRMLRDDLAAAAGGERQVAPPPEPRTLTLTLPPGCRVVVEGGE